MTTPYAMTYAGDRAIRLMWEAGRTAHCKHTLARAIAERAGLIKDDPHQ